MIYMLIVNGKDLVLGRLATFAAKRLLAGERVIVVNAEQAVISGKRESTLGAYTAWLNTRNLTNPRKGPIHFKRPEELVRRTIRGMLPFDKPRGRAAYRRLRVHAGVPKSFADKKMQTVPGASVEQLKTRRFIRIGELSKHLGGMS